MGVRPHFLVDLIVYLVSLAAIYTLRRWNSERQPATVTRRVHLGLTAAAVWLTLGIVLTPSVIARHVPNFWLSWIRAGAIVIAVWTIAAIVLARCWKSLPS